MLNVQCLCMLLPMSKDLQRLGQAETPIKLHGKIHQPELDTLFYALFEVAVEIQKPAESTLTCL